MTKLMSKEDIIISKLLIWYTKNKRILPWRIKKNTQKPVPYYIFVSEFMLQQTTVNEVTTKFNYFIKKWPDLLKFSKCNESDVLKFWSGLGYYRRAINLLKSAKIISLKHKNKIPNNYSELINLPGIGEYTAKAILGIAFNQPVFPIDANIARIIVRLYGFNQSLNLIQKKIKKKSEFYEHKFQSSNLIQSFMDYGSMICVPRNPKCNICILSNQCIANKKKISHLIPIKTKSPVQKKIKYSRSYVIISNEKEILIRKRNSVGMLASLLEVPNDTWVARKKLLSEDAVLNNFKNKRYKSGSIQYSFSHFILKTEIFLIKVKKINIPSHRWILIKKIERNEFPTLMKKIIQNALEKNKIQRI